MNTHWYKTVLAAHGKEILYTTIGSLVLSLVILFGHFVLGYKFSWKEITPIPEPDVFVRLLYSALVFITLGALLYKLKFYKVLYTIFGKWMGDYRLYKDLKSLIWTGLILLMFFVIVPTVVHLLNAILSLLYNLLGIVLYLSPLLGATIILSIAGQLLYLKLHHELKKLHSS